MFTIILIFASGLKLLLPLPDTTENDSKQGCEHAAVAIAHYINHNVPDDDKVIVVECLRNS